MVDDRRKDGVFLSLLVPGDGTGFGGEGLQRRPGRETVDPPVIQAPDFYVFLHMLA